jgi:pSer/pThr/pTyr-binding forkhead associated (FHA) protein
MKSLTVQPWPMLETRYAAGSSMRNMLWEADWEPEHDDFLQAQLAEKWPCLLRENCRGYELFPLGGHQYLVGRSPECDIWIHDPFISLCHATLVQVPEPAPPLPPVPASLAHPVTHARTPSSLDPSLQSGQQSAPQYDIFDGYLETATSGECRQFASRNGLRVNGIPVQVKRLQDGDRVELGDMVLTYHLRTLDDDGLLF